MAYWILVEVDILIIILLSSMFFRKKKKNFIEVKDEEGKSYKKHLNSEESKSIDEVLKKKGIKVYLVLVKGPWVGYKEFDSTIFVDDISENVDKDGVAYAFCRYKNGEPEYFLTKKYIWYNFEKFNTITDNTNLSSEEKERQYINLINSFKVND